MRLGGCISLLRGLLAVVAVGCALAPGAAAEQAAQPASAAAGRLDLGRYHSCVVLGDASVRCWGYGGDGALGYASTATIGDDETPAAAPAADLGAGRTAVALSAGAVHTCALLDHGAVRCWGFGGDGRLGYGTTDSIGDDEPPGAAGPVDLGASAQAITAGRAHSCALLNGGSVRCWGFGFDGRLGYGNTENIGDDELPSEVGPVKLGAPATAITAGGSHTCALLAGGSVLCWGFGGNGQLGTGTTSSLGDVKTPDTGAAVNFGNGHTAVAVSAGDFHTCAVLDDGTVRCWGYGGNGRLGYGDTQSIGDDEQLDRVGPVDLGGHGAVAISAGADHTCALLDDGSVRCWGYGGNGRLGYASTQDIGDDETPGSVGPVGLGAGRTAVAISAGGNGTCATLDDGSVRCWGDGANGRLGYCSGATVGDDESPGSAGPVDLGVAGSPGAGCASAPPAPAAQPSTPPSGGGGGAYTLPPPDPAAAALAAQKMRAAALRGCLHRVSARARHDRRRARHRSGRKRASALRRITRRAARGRRNCLKRHGRTPGRIAHLAAVATGRHTVRLTFRAAGTDHAKPPAARSYLIKQSLHRIRGRRRFRRAGALCKGSCAFKVTAVGARIKLTIAHLRRHRTYFYAVAARDNVSARTGPRSKTVKAHTR